MCAGTSKAAEPYRVGKKMTSFMLEILNLNKTELVSIDIISNQEFTEVSSVNTFISGYFCPFLLIWFHCKVNIQQSQFRVKN
jgi:hypothetical protein